MEECKNRSSKKNSNKNNVNNSFSKKTVHDRLIIKDHVSGLADISKKSAAFLTVTRKYNYNYVYNFHKSFLKKEIGG